MIDTVKFLVDRLKTLPALVSRGAAVNYLREANCSRPYVVVSVLPSTVRRDSGSRYDHDNLLVTVVSSNQTQATELLDAVVDSMFELANFNLAPGKTCVSVKMIRDRIVQDVRETNDEVFEASVGYEFMVESHRMPQGAR